MKHLYTHVLSIVIASHAFFAINVFADNQTNDFFDLPLEEALNTIVTSVGKKEQTVHNSAAAVFVITQDDIQRSGYTSLPEVLRLAPGIHVAKVAGSQYAIGMRGFNGLYTSKLLVLIDGRSIYHMMTAGVWWDQHDIALEEVERIEVIRGPGATLWGSNAVNGIINIITYSAKDTKGALVSAHAGSEERMGTVLRYGDSVGPTDYRIYAKYVEHDNAVLKDGSDAYDQWKTSRLGFRTDTEINSQDSLTVQGEGMYGTSGWDIVLPSLTEYQIPDDQLREVYSGHLLSRWTRKFSDSSEMQLQVYYESAARNDDVIPFENDLFDIDFQYRLPLAKDHDFMWGLEARQYTDDYDSSFAVAVPDEHERLRQATAFVQDDITLVAERLKLIVGSKFENSDYSDFEIEPNIRMLWTPDKESSAWVAISRAVSTPARYNQNGDVTFATLPPSAEVPLPTRLHLYGVSTVDAENLLAYEVGYRNQIRKDLSLDFATFYNEYDELESAEPYGPPSIASDGNVTYVDVPFALMNKLAGSSVGFEVSADYRPTSWWRMVLNYSYLNINLHHTDGGSDFIYIGQERSAPDNQAMLTSRIDLPHNMEFDTNLRYVDSVPSFKISPYMELDLRVAKHFSKNLELSLVGQNLLDSQHLEYQSNFVSSPRQESQRGVYAKVSYKF